MEKGTKHGVSGGVLFLIVILCLGLGLTSGYILNDKVLKKDEVKENKKNESVHKETKNTETEIKKNNNTDKVVDTSNICKDNNQKCEEETTISNNEKTYKLKIISNSNSTELFIDDDSIYYDNNIVIKQIALLDNNILVIETELQGHDGNTITRSYLSENMTVLFENRILDLRERNFKEDITAKEFTGYTYSKTCGKEGIKQSIYKIKLISSNEIEQEFISSKYVYVAQC